MKEVFFLPLKLGLRAHVTATHCMFRHLIPMEETLAHRVLMSAEVGSDIGIDVAMETEMVRCNVVYDQNYNGLSFEERVIVPNAVEAIATYGLVYLAGGFAAVGPAGLFFIGAGVAIYVFIGTEPILDAYKSFKDTIREMVADAEARRASQPCQLYEDWMTSKELIDYRPSPDPLVLDMNNDGVKTISIAEAVHFDQDGNGFAERTGWASADDGLLVLDRNGDGKINNGKELFGDQFVLASGKTASNGFEALAEFDVNQDGKIDPNDVIYSRLQVWQDSDGDGLCSPDELHSLNDLGIAAINLDSILVDQTDPNGNHLSLSGSFERSDGSTGQIGQFNLQRNLANTIATDWLEVPDDIADLPDLDGSGNVYDLHQAMVRDTTGQLKSLVEQFVAADDMDEREQIMEQILFEWAGDQRIQIKESSPPMLAAGSGSGGGGSGSGSVGGGSDDDLIDDRKLAVLEHFFGEPWSGVSGRKPNYAASVILDDSYREIFEMMYADLMAQTHLKDLYSKLLYRLDEENLRMETDFTVVIPDLVVALDNDSEAGKELIGEFARSLRGISTCSAKCYLTFREHMLEIDPELGWVFDSGGLPVYDAPFQGIRWWSGAIEGTHGSGAIKGSLTLGYGRLDGLSGDDVIYGTDRNEMLINEAGDALLVAGGGADTIRAGDGADILDGGPGDDQLYGQGDNDTYIFRRGSGNDLIVDRDATEGNVDTIWLGSELTPEDIIVRRVGSNLVLTIIDTSDTLTVRFHFAEGSTLNQIECIQFMNAGAWYEEDIIAATRRPSEGDDIIYGTEDWESIRGLGGNDEIHGMVGYDVLNGNEGDDKLYGGLDGDELDGGPGNDYMDGEQGPDLYLFGRGSGQDIIEDTGTDAVDPNAEFVDMLQFGEGISVDDLTQELVGNDLKLTIIDTGDSITIKNWLNGDTPGGGVEAIQFADGSRWTLEGITSGLLRGSYWDDCIYGFSTSDTIEGFEGNDVVYARYGDDVVDGGPGRDILYGEFGDDTLLGQAGDDWLLGAQGDDILVGGSGADVLESRWGNDTLTGGPGDDHMDGGSDDDSYYFGRGSGHDTVRDHGSSDDLFDSLHLTDDIIPEDVALQRIDLDLKITIVDTAESVTLLNWFWEHPEQNDTVDYIHFSDGTIWDVDTIRDMLIQGTPANDLLIGYGSDDQILGLESDDTIYGRPGDDFLAGGSGDDHLAGELGNDFLVGGAGADVLEGGYGDDTLDGGPGDDILNGGTKRQNWWDHPVGNDTYLFGRGSGHDTILDRDDTPGNLDAIVLDSDVLPTDVTLRRVDEKLVLSIHGTTDTLTVENWFLDEAYYWEDEDKSFYWQVEEIRFGDGTVWDVDAMKLMAIQGTPDDDLLFAYSTDDTISGLAGRDRIYAGAGNDTIDPGAGDDYAEGGIGNDTYMFGRNSGHDNIVDQDSTPGNHDTILLNADVLPADVTVRHVNESLVLTITDTGDTLTVEKWFMEESTEWQVEEILFADGTTWDVDTIKQMALQGTPVDDIITGYSTSDTILGLAGADVLVGRDGADTLDGGPDADRLDGGLGNDIYVFERGSGQDVIVDWDPTAGNIDTVRLGADVQESDATLKRAGNHLFLSINGTDDSMKLSDWFSADADKIEQIQFGDGTIWDAAYMYTKTTTPTDTDDYLVGTADKDLMDGGGGDDILYGRENDDTLFGGAGQDEIYAEEGNDTVYGGADNDSLFSGSGDDQVFGEAGDDYLEAESGNNLLDGGSGDDELVASSGDDHLVGGSGADRLDAGAGTNILEAGAGDDEIIAEQGQNTIVFDQGDGFDTVYSRIESTAPEGAVLVKDLAYYNVTEIGQALNVNGTLFFLTLPLMDSGQTELLWKSDGTEAGTVIIDGVYPETVTAPSDLTDVNGTLFFTADNQVYGRELWKTDGTDAGTVLVKDIALGSDGGEGEGGGSSEAPRSSAPQNLTNVNGTLFFTADDNIHGYEIWKSDGTEAGTVMVKDIVSGSSGSNPYQLTDVNGTLFFTANDGVHGFELWMSDGTEAGTVMVKDIVPGSGDTSMSSLTDVNGTLFFTANDGVHGTELWMSDGTEAGTAMVKDITAGSSSTSLHSFTNVNGTLFFIANDGTHGYELWKSDGTEAGTVMVEDINPDAGSINDTDVVVVGDTLFFVANDGIHGRELWKSDGTETGTVMVKDANPGSGGGAYGNLTDVNGTLYFAAYDGTHGYELWKSDGTEAGTVMVHDVREGGAGSYPSELTDANGTLFFTAEYGFFGSGFGLWKVDASAASSDEDADTITFGAGITRDDITVQTRVGDIDSGYGMQLLIGTGNGEGMLIEAPASDGFSPSDLAIKNFAFDDGTILTLNEILALSDGVIGYQEGTANDDILGGSMLDDEIWGLDGDDAIVGRDGDDWLEGDEGNDVISADDGDDGVGGWTGDDVLAGGRGADYLFGDEGDDVYAFNRGDGQDYIDNTSYNRRGRYGHALVRRHDYS